MDENINYLHNYWLIFANEICKNLQQEKKKQLKSQ